MLEKYALNSINQKLYNYFNNLLEINPNNSKLSIILSSLQKCPLPIHNFSDALELIGIGENFSSQIEIFLKENNLYKEIAYKRDYQINTQKNNYIKQCFFFKSM